MLKTHYWLCWGKTFSQNPFFNIIYHVDRSSLGKFLLDKQVILYHAIPFYGYHILGQSARKKQLLEWLDAMLLYLDMGYPFIECLSLVKNGLPNAIRMNLLNHIEHGVTFVQTLQQHPLYFDNQWIECLHHQDVRTLFKIWSTQLQQELNLFNNIQQQLLYPGIICMFALLFIIFFKCVMFPQYQHLYEQLHIENSFMTHHYLFYFMSLPLALLPLKKHLPWLNRLKTLKEWYRWLSYMHMQSELGYSFYTSIKSSIPFFQHSHFIEMLNHIEQQLRLGYPIQTILPTTLPPILYHTLLHQPNTNGFANCLKIFEQKMIKYCKKIELLIQPFLLFLLSMLCGGLMFMIYQPILKMAQHL